MAWIAGENTWWAAPDDDDLHQEPMLVVLWRKAKEDAVDDYAICISMTPMRRRGPPPC
jgi:hypothetical protein